MQMAPRLRIELSGFTFRPNNCFFIGFLFIIIYTIFFYLISKFQFNLFNWICIKFYKNINFDYIINDEEKFHAHALQIMIYKKKKNLINNT